MIEIKTVISERQLWLFGDETRYNDTASTLNVPALAMIGCFNSLALVKVSFVL